MAEQLAAAITSFVIAFLNRPGGFLCGYGRTHNRYDAGHFINTNYSLPAMTPYKFNASIGTAVCIIIIPLVDTLRLVILRLSKRQSPFHPDKSHVHHAIMRLGMRHSQTTLILAAVHIFYIALALVFQDLDDAYVLSGVIILSFLLSVSLDRLIINKL